MEPRNESLLPPGSSLALLADASSLSYLIPPSSTLPSSLFSLLPSLAIPSSLSGHPSLCAWPSLSTYIPALPSLLGPRWTRLEGASPPQPPHKCRVLYHSRLLPSRDERCGHGSLACAYTAPRQVTRQQMAQTRKRLGEKCCLPTPEQHPPYSSQPLIRAFQEHSHPPASFSPTSRSQRQPHPLSPSPSAPAHPYPSSSSLPPYYCRVPAPTEESNSRSPPPAAFGPTGYQACTCDSLGASHAALEETTCCNQPYQATGTSLPTCTP